MFFCITSRSLPMKVWSSVLRLFSSSFSSVEPEKMERSMERERSRLSMRASNTEPENGFVRYESAPVP